MKIFLIFLLTFSLYSSDNKKEHHLSKDLSSLELTSEQKEIAKSIIKQFRVDIKAFREFKEKLEDEKESLVMREVLHEDDLQCKCTIFEHQNNAKKLRITLMRGKCNEREILTYRRRFGNEFSHR